MNQTTAGTKEPLSKEDILEAINEFKKMDGESKLSLWMRSMGFDPQEGGTLFIPEE